ncbi:glycogen debranching protein GlgX [Chitiniphilus purpureus]|uniref:Glycogen debranching protein GlgX n=1 Tax=Chitiniphilus purpureus TaxID=2981137 RepID=A0ABY6DQH8_9NEIS|nr:glycogen debranching protein GlgX [Chitiniphilus sp. CD1]UXY15351.1 glycogen debranching protein GlgX [Chitiniphilus sp. CD1]
MLSLPDRLEEGRPFPLGAHWDGQGVNFAVFSASAHLIELCVFDERGRKEVARYALPACTDEIWHGYLPDAKPGLLYGYRAYGPYDPGNGHRFNPNKLLLDPYARRIVGEIKWNPAVFGYKLGSHRADLTFDKRDSAASMPKCMVEGGGFNWSGDRAPAVPWRDTIIYETHVRGVSQQRQDIAPHKRGTFAALADPRFIDHLHKLGITAIELLPVQAFTQDSYLKDKGLANYWGYNTLSYFAPEPRYLSNGSLDEIRSAVRRLHAAGIEVILDVVYNHTCEGNELGPTLSWRGLDNASYYRLLPDERRYYINDTGCGNTLNLSHPRVLQMVMDSLRHWVDAYHVDGFRFDLGCTLGREAWGFDPGCGFFDALKQDPQLQHVKLISEPWDCGPGGYVLGQHPPGFAEWNDQFRDTVRAYWRGDSGTRAPLAARMAGSADYFDKRHRKPWASINFITAHDGFTLADLVSYNDKHNEANGEGNCDGHSDNRSNNWGVEGETDDPAVLHLRERVQRALLGTLLLSTGTPMLLGGDEFGRSQQGNNNTYCQDNGLSWYDWSQANSEEGRALTRYVARLVNLRRQCKSLGAPGFPHGETETLPGVADLAFFDERGEPLSEADWHNGDAKALAVRRSGVDAQGDGSVSLVLLNGGSGSIYFTLPPGPDLPWQIEIESAFHEHPARPLGDADGVEVPGNSMALLLASVRIDAMPGPRRRKPPAEPDPAPVDLAQADDEPLQDSLTIDEAEPV